MGGGGEESSPIQTLLELDIFNTWQMLGFVTPEDTVSVRGYQAGLVPRTRFGVLFTVEFFIHLHLNSRRVWGRCSSCLSPLFQSEA